MLPIIQSLWIGENLSAIERLTVRSYLANGHSFHLYVYDDVKNIPDGTVIRDANTILPEAEVFLAHQGSYAIFADWFRWSLLKKNGGLFWVDMDQVCLKPFEFDDEIVFGHVSANRPGVGVLRFPAGHPVPEEMVKRCEESKTRADDLSWGEAGGAERIQGNFAKFRH